MRWTSRFGFFALALLACGYGSAEEFFFKDGDKVVMIGDSITEQHLYSNFVETWVTTRFPGWKLTFRNVGISGDRSPGGNERFTRDVAFFKPTALTVDFGMNDGGYRAFDESGFKTYLEGLKGMADQAKAAHIRVAWLTPQPIDNADPGPTALTGYNETLEKYSAGLKTIAVENGGLFVDQFHPYLNVLNGARSRQQTYVPISGGDPVHPWSPGQALMAASILKGIHFPTTVSSVSIDLVSGRIDAERAAVMDLKKHEGGVTFLRKDEGLPYFPEHASGILPWAPLCEELNRYTLKITGLNAGNYDIRLGGVTVAQYTAADLGKGVNLAEAALKTGPVAEQVRAIESAIRIKNEYHHDQIFRGVHLAPVQIPPWLNVKVSPAEIEARKQEVLKERYAELEKRDEAVWATLPVKGHTVEIIPARS